MKCARCQREMDKPALVVGPLWIGPKCMKLMGLQNQSAELGRYLRNAISRKKIEDKDQLNLFDTEK